MHATLLITLLLCIVVLFCQQVQAFKPVRLGIKSNIVAPRDRNMKLMMGGNKAKFSYFSPFVVAAKFILGDQKLNKVNPS